MKKPLMLFFISCIFFSAAGWSQTADSVETPKLNKFQQMKQNSRDAAAAEAAVPPPATTTVNNTIPNNQQSRPAIPAASQAVNSNAAIIPDNLPPTPEVPAENVVEKTDPVVPENVVTQNTPAPQVQPSQQQPEKTIYRTTRLGSSTKVYNTYEKNNNGAGSVTTSPK